MVLKLDDVNSWTTDHGCTQTALAAISGKTPAEVEGLLAKVVADRTNQPPDPKPRRDYSPEDWCVAVNRLGGNWGVWQTYRRTEGPTIEQWMAAHRAAKLTLVNCIRSDKIGHVFATEGGSIVDIYTHGRKVPFSIGLPGFDEYREFRVVQTIQVF